jgi:hypothetical protein
MVRNLQRICDENILKRIMDCKSERRRKIERPKLGCFDIVLEDIIKLEVNNWWTVSRAREAWERPFGKPRSHWAVKLPMMMVMMMIMITII